MAFDDFAVCWLMAKSIPYEKLTIIARYLFPAIPERVLRRLYTH